MEGVEVSSDPLSEFSPLIPLLKQSPIDDALDLLLAHFMLGDSLVLLPVNVEPGIE